MDRLSVILSLICSIYGIVFSVVEFYICIANENIFGWAFIIIGLISAYWLKVTIKEIREGRK